MDVSRLYESRAADGLALVNMDSKIDQLCNWWLFVTPLRFLVS